ncbi:MAG: hypothetical protein ACO1SX_26925 [Actinomycetota bacterium]
MVRVTLWTALLVAAAVMGPRPAAAQQLQSFPTRESLNAAANNELLGLDFEELPEFFSYETLTYPGVTVRSTNTAVFSLMALGPGSFPALPSNTLISIEASNPEPSPLILEFTTPVTAVGLDLNAFAPDGVVSPAGSSFVVTVEGTDGSQSFVLPLTEGAPTFLGLGATSGSISRVTVANPVGQTRFVAADDLLYGDLPAGIEAVLDDIEQVLADGKAAGKIGKLGTSLEDKLAEVRAAVEAEDGAAAAAKLKAFANQVRAQRGKKIAAAVADALASLVSDGLALL